MIRLSIVGPSSSYAGSISINARFATFSRTRGSLGNEIARWRINVLQKPTVRLGCASGCSGTGRQSNRSTLVFRFDQLASPQRVDVDGQCGRDNGGSGMSAAIHVAGLRVMRHRHWHRKVSYKLFRISASSTVPWTRNRHWQTRCARLFTWRIIPRGRETISSVEVAEATCWTQQKSGQFLLMTIWRTRWQR